MTDTVGHGTFIAGLIAAIDGNGIGGRGVAGATPIMPVRLTTNENISDAAAAAGIVWAVDHGARVINLSFGGAGLSQIETSALDYAHQHDVLVVAAAGNNADAQTNRQPGAVPRRRHRGHARRVEHRPERGRHDALGRPRAVLHLQRLRLDRRPGRGRRQLRRRRLLHGPGNTTLLWDGNNACAPTFGAVGNPDGRYGYGEGTSFSTPIVAGAAALVRGANTRLTAEQTGDVLRRSAHQTLGTGWNQRTGRRRGGHHGRGRAGAAVRHHAAHAGPGGGGRSPPPSR